MSSIAHHKPLKCKRFSLKIFQFIPDRDSSSDIVLYTVPTGVVIIVIVAVVVLVLILRRKRTERSGLRANVVYRPNATVNKYKFDDDATATTSNFNAKTTSTDNDHIYEEIKEGYDQLRFNFKPTPVPKPIQIPKPMPFSQHTLDHYDNAKLLRRDYKS